LSAQAPDDFLSVMTNPAESEPLPSPVPSEPSQPAPSPPVVAPPVREISRETRAKYKTKPAEPLAVIILYLLAVFLGAALIAPRFHATAQFLAEHNHYFDWLAQQPFHRYVNRSLQLLALVGLPAFVKALRFKSAQELGLRFRSRDWIEAAQGLGWGFAAISIATALAISFGARVLDPERSSEQILRHIRNTIPVAVLVACLEELLFRGALFGGLRRRYSFWAAAILSSAFFGIVHFLARPKDAGIVEWNSGLIILGQMLSGFTEWKLLFPGFLNLSLTGILLALCYERTRTLLFPIALHAALIFGVKSVGFATKTIDAANSWVWGSSKLVDGWATAFVLVAIIFALKGTLPRPAQIDD
jgi:membrane protease YdiL (CAAX protease family)